MQGFDLSTISDCYIGNNQVSEIWLGQTKIWPTTSHDYSQDYLTFKALQPTSFSFSQNDLQYSLDDGTTWTTLTTGTSTPTLSAGDKILWKQTGLIPNVYDQPYGIGTFSATGNFDAYGNIMSLYYGDNFSGQTGQLQSCAFENLFINCTKIINTKNLILPATSLRMNCYCEMFKGCTSLITSPVILPAYELYSNCYSGMFNGCTSLTTAPQLQATILAPYCYSEMFRDCASLTTAPILLATSTSSQCYKQMFQGCTSLVNVQSVLPATGIAFYGYAAMFYGCTSLTRAPEISATSMDNYACDSMFYGCTSLTTAPTLRPVTLTKRCYYKMFYGCTLLNYIKCLATDLSASECLVNWVYGIASSGTFVKASSATWPTGDNGIPNNWTVQNA